MAVVTPDGIVGKVIAAYPTASEVLLVTDPDFAAGVISQKNGVRGTLKGQGTPSCKLDYVPVEEKIEVGEVLYTSGDDRIFPRGFPAGVVKVVRNGQPFKEILVEPSGLQHGLEDVLIIVEGVHQEIPSVPPANQPVYIAPPPPAAEPKTPPATEGGAPAQTGTEADRLRAVYKAVGDAQNHTFGEGLPGSKPPDFTQLSVAPTGTAGTPPPPAGQQARRGSTPRGRLHHRSPRRPQAARHAAQSQPGRRSRTRGTGALMDYSTGRLLVSQHERQSSKYRAWVLLAVPLAALLFQISVPRFFQVLGFLDMPLLVVIYFSLMWRSQLGGLAIGALIGLAQDSLSHDPLGMFGIDKTLVGLLCGLGGRSPGCGQRHPPPAAFLFLLPVSPMPVLGDGARSAGPAAGFRGPALAPARIAERRGGDLPVPFPRQAAGECLI